VVLGVDLRQLGASALTAAIEVPKGRSLEDMKADIPVTYVPARNTVFLALALGYAEVVGAADIFIGVNAIDYSGYPDCRPQYIAVFQELANLATKAGVEGRLRFAIHTPLAQMNKAEIIRRGTALGVDYALTHSCYDPNSSGLSCGRCDACLLRLKGFAEAGLADPLPYQVGEGRKPPTKKPRGVLQHHEGVAGVPSSERIAVPQHHLHRRKAENRKPRADR